MTHIEARAEKVRQIRLCRYYLERAKEELGLTRFVLEIPDPRGDVSRERIEFYQEPSLFNLRKETSNA